MLLPHGSPEPGGDCAGDPPIHLTQHPGNDKQLKLPEGFPNQHPPRGPHPLTALPRLICGVLPPNNKKL